MPPDRWHAAAGKDPLLKKNRISVRGLAAATGTAVAVGALTVGMNAWAAEPSSNETAVTRIGPLPDGAEVRRGAVAPGKTLADIEAKQQRQAQARAQARAKARAAARAKAAAAAKARAERLAQQRASRAAARKAATVVSGDPRSIARQLASSRYGWGASQFDCLDTLWGNESGWDVHAQNPSSGAYGIPQALPGSKMSEYGSDWRDNAATQIKWGLSYIDGRYGSPCSAMSTQQSQGWY